MSSPETSQEPICPLWMPSELSGTNSPHKYVDQVWYGFLVTEPNDPGISGISWVPGVGSMEAVPEGGLAAKQTQPQNKEWKITTTPVGFP